ncbi:unnamed protein product [Caenorhabditis angaria]|uniref:Acyl_transf_3 domain-containing protein n=1 Tax=Caenorhabditis angaria TaxID=860376 RepID=A0A9P1IGT2_9PELO|nr:unnamed protein product [Caenorhabditis angaria]
MSGKILDLQGIRGIAILAVLGFHFFPKCFPNGYLGVDLFFVLSGFLVCMLLTGSEAENMTKIEIFCDFYTRRLRRIVPLYFLFILTSLISLHTFFPKIVIERNEKSAKRAIFFISNQLKSNEDNYFEQMNSAFDIFTHTWSISVEIQFYLLAPFIFLVNFGKLPRKCVFSGLLLMSYGYNFMYLQEDLAFFDIFARFWQFFMGILVYLFWREKRSQDDYDILMDNEDSEENEKKNNWIFQTVLVVLLIFGVFLPIPIHAKFLSLIIFFVIPIIAILNLEKIPSKISNPVEMMNIEWSLKDQQNLRYSKCFIETGHLFGKCYHSDLNSDSNSTKNEKKFKIMLFGNSWAANHAAIVHEECGGKASEILQIAAAGCEPLVELECYDGCNKFSLEIQENLKNFRPDYAFHIVRPFGLTENSTENLENDRIFQFMLEKTQEISKFVSKKLYFLNSIPDVNTRNIARIVQFLERNQTDQLDKILIDSENHYEIARNRITNLVEKCGEKCEIIDYYPLFFNEKTGNFRFYDENGYSYLTGGNHLSPKGLEFIRPVWRKLCEGI